MTDLGSRGGAAVTGNSLIIRHGGEGDRLWFTGGGLHTWKVTAEETGGAFLCFEDQMTAGKVTPLHAHPGIHEVVYVLDGEIRVWDDGAERAVTTGGFVLVQPGAAHAFLTVQPPEAKRDRAGSSGFAGQRVCVAVNHLPPAVDTAEDVGGSQVLAAGGPADSCACVLDPDGVADVGSEVS